MVETKRNLKGSEALWKERTTWVPMAPFNYTKMAIGRAQGAKVWDVDGNEYIDFVGGIGALNVGHNHPKVVAAIKAQLDKFIHTSFHVMVHENYMQAAKRVAQAAPGDSKKKVMFFNSGAEAVENAVKAAKAFTKRPNVIAFDLSFHGRTYLAMTLTGKVDPYRKGFGPVPPGVFHSPFPYTYRPPKGVSPGSLTAYCLDQFERLLKTRVVPEQVAAVVTEVIQGEGGFIVPTPGFLEGIQAICRKHGILLIADEIQSGMGRTGRMWAGDHFGLVPDILTTAKSLAAGMPLSAVVARDEIFDAVHDAGMGGTYNGHALSCAAALAAIDVLEEEKLVERGEKLGKLIQERFDSFVDKFPFVGESRGLGPMRGFELVKDKTTKEPIDEKQAFGLLEACAERGLLIIKAGLYNNVLRTLVPLVISDEELNRGLDILEDVLKDFKP